MSVDIGSHFSRDTLELYALGMFSAHDCSDLEEHFLVCPHCQTRLEAVDTYIGVVRAAYVVISSRSPGLPRAGAIQAAES